MHQRPVAGFQTCCIADFQIGRASLFRAPWNGARPAGLETRDTADSEVCATMRVRKIRVIRSHQSSSQSNNPFSPESEPRELPNAAAQITNHESQRVNRKFSGSRTRRCNHVPHRCSWLGRFRPHPLPRRWRTSCPACWSRNADISFRASWKSARGFRYRGRICHNEIRRSAWMNHSRTGGKKQSKCLKSPA